MNPRTKRKTDPASIASALKELAARRKIFSIHQRSDRIFAEREVKKRKEKKINK